jgi:hypothetical protein
VRSQTVTLPETVITTEQEKEHHHEERYTRAQRAHWRLSWDERLSRNARPTQTPSLTITLHGLPASFAQFFGLDLVATA